MEREARRVHLYGTRLWVYLNAICSIGKKKVGFFVQAGDWNLAYNQSQRIACSGFGRGLTCYVGLKISNSSTSSLFAALTTSISCAASGPRWSRPAPIARAMQHLRAVS